MSAACDPVNYDYFAARTTLRGDVVGLIKAAAGFAQAATYRYDPWGRVLSRTGLDSLDQPIRYASYDYDEDVLSRGEVLQPGAGEG